MPEYRTILIHPCESPAEALFSNLREPPQTWLPILQGAPGGGGPVTRHAAVYSAMWHSDVTVHCGPKNVPCSKLFAIISANTNQFR